MTMKKPVKLERNYELIRWASNRILVREEHESRINCCWNRNIDRSNCEYECSILSEKCAELGIDVYFHTAVGDNEQRLLSVLEIASKRSDLVILCGGLGPTEDDLTKQTLATFLQKELVADELAMAKLDRFLPVDQVVFAHPIMSVKHRLWREVRRYRTQLV